MCGWRTTVTYRKAEPPLAVTAFDAATICRLVLHRKMSDQTVAMSAACADTRQTTCRQNPSTPARQLTALRQCKHASAPQAFRPCSTPAQALRYQAGTKAGAEDGVVRPTDVVAKRVALVAKLVGRVPSQARTTGPPEGVTKRTWHTACSERGGCVC